MKKTRYYLKFGEQKSTFGVDPKEWFEEFGWEFIKANNVKVYIDKDLKQLYCYEKPTRLLRNEWSQTAYSSHSADLILDYEKEVEVKETVTKLPADTRYANGYNWKNAHVRGANSRLRKPNSSANPYNKLNPKGKPPINPKTGRRDGGA